MNRETIRACREFIENRKRQRHEVALRLKLDMAHDNLFEEVGRRLGELKPFIDYFFKEVEERFGGGPEFYTQFNISRQVWSNMQRDDYDPTINTVYKIIIGLRLSLMDAVILLENAGYSLTFKTTTQLVVIFCVINGIYNTADVDLLLVTNDTEPLFSI